VATLAQSTTLYVNVVRVFVTWVVRDMCNEALHHVAFIIASGATDGVKGRSELNDAVRYFSWFAGRRDVALVTEVYRSFASTKVGVISYCAGGRYFNCC
jgi:hypothetical protein